MIERKKIFSKGPKKGHFPKALLHGFCLKIKFSLIAVFHIKFGRKDSFWIF